MKSSPPPSQKRPPTSSAQWQRARRPEQKAERSETILAAATSLLDEKGVEGATLTEIARRAGVSKANCYRYFESREAILLELAIDAARVWAAQVIERLAPLAGSGDVDAVASAFARTTANCPRLCMLYSSISSVLERNVSAEAIAAFKRSFNPAIFGTIDSVRDAIPELSIDQVETFLVFLGMAIAGTWPSANPPPAVAEVLLREEFAARKIEFEPALFTHSRVVLLGLLAEPRP